VKKVHIKNVHKRRKRRKQKGVKLTLFSVLVFLFICFVAVESYKFAFNNAKNYTQNLDKKEKYGNEVTVTIPEDSSTKDIAEILKKNGLIKSTLFFRFQSRYKRYDGEYVKGTYNLAEGMNNDEIMDILTSDEAQNGAIKVTVPEGYTAKQIAELLEEKGVVSADSFINEMNNGTFDYDFLKDTGNDRSYRLEGYLFPATYEFNKDMDAHKVIETFFDRFNIEYSNILENAKSKYTSDELVTIASIVESEIQVDSERPIAAEVIYNRLSKGMKLQIDSTVQYALQSRNEEVTYNDLDVDSPYNTYKNTGLPPGPICCPGEASLKAAVNPDNNDYIYYVLKKKGSGEHVFTSSYDDFLAAKDTYKKSAD
jgi:UPF0755 protein